MSTKNSKTISGRLVKKLATRHAHLTQQIRILENFVTHSKLKGKTGNLCKENRHIIIPCVKEEQKYLHPVTISDSTERLSRAQIATLRIQKRKNILNFLLSVVLFGIIAYFLLLLSN